MKIRLSIVLLAAYSATLLSTAATQPPALTIYNDGFGVVRQTLPLDLQPGENKLSFSGVTAHLEPQSVLLRDPSGQSRIAILEQSYRADPISQGLLLSHFEGQEIQFQRFSSEPGEPTLVTGRIIRSGYQPHYSAMSRYGNQYAQRQRSMASQGGGQPVIEIDGKIQFGLPGQPLFPSLPDDSILKPTLDWILHSENAARTEAQLSYLTSGLAWQADYNIFALEGSDKVEVVGWITMDNQTGTSFQDAKIKLIAGDVNRVQADADQVYELSPFTVAESVRASPQIEEKSFDEYHLYSLPRPTTLLDRETKQVEFLRAKDVAAPVTYVYDGAFINPMRYRGWDSTAIRQDEAFGTESNPKVWIIREIENSEENGLGIALPKGKTRFYRQDDDGQLEFTGENAIDHTAKKETLKIYTGNAFDLVGERNRTDYQLDRRSYVNEAFEIVVKNRKEAPVVIRVVEHLYRWSNWEIQENSQPYEKVDADTIAFEVELPADSERKVSYKVHYTW